MEAKEWQQPGAGQGQPASGREAQRSTWVSVAVNLVLTVAQVIVGLLAASQALVADGPHGPIALRLYRHGDGAGLRPVVDAIRARIGAGARCRRCAGRPVRDPSSPTSVIYRW